MAPKKEIRGIRNNNPGNIEKSPPQPWQGLAEDQPDKRFLKFKTPAWGIRAICILLINYQDKYGIHTIHGIIKRWAPPSENNTKAYVNAIAAATGFEATERLDMHSYDHLRPVVEAIIAHECAGYKYPAATVDEGLRRAGVVPAKKSIMSEPGAKPAAATAAVAVASPVVDAINEAKGSFSDMAYFSDTARYVFIALTIAGVAYAVYRFWKTKKESA